MSFISLLLSDYNKCDQIDIFLNFVLLFFHVFTMKCYDYSRLHMRDLDTILVERVLPN